MISIRNFIRPPNNGELALWAVGGLGVFFLLSVIFVKAGGEGMMAACLFYALVVTFFLGALIMGFVNSQTRYTDAIEDIKYQVLEREREEWGE